MDSAWVGVIGVVVGGVITSGFTLGTRLLDVQDRTRTTAREDQLRYLDERKALYAEWLEHAEKMHRLVSTAALHQMMTSNPDAIEAHKAAIRELQDGYEPVRADLRRKEVLIELLCHEEVQTPVRQFIEKVVMASFMVGSPTEEMRAKSIDAVAQIATALDVARRALRADLKISDSY